jgi:hypothetical protein
MMNDITERVTLPTGLWVDGICHKTAEVRALTGSDEVFLLEAGQSLLPAQRTTALLARCLIELGPARDKTAAVRGLTVGDRDSLMLHVRLLTIGKTIQATVRCPNPDCSERMDLELKVNDLLVPPYSNCQEWYQQTINVDEKTWDVCFRLPTGADQEAVANIAHTDPQAAAEALLRRCTKSDGNGNGSFPKQVPMSVFTELSARMAKLDPQAELILQATCPICAHAFSTELDISTYFFHELKERIKRVYMEVHTLAFRYHWSEHEIMAMTPTRRRLYLDLLANEFSERARR